MNHYATNTFFDHGGRHYYFTKYLMREGYDVTVFCASTVHNSDKNIEVPTGKYTVDFVDRIPYVFVKTPSYTGNGKKRIQNMFSFYRNLFPVTKSYGKETGWPDVILASSVHPLTLVAGIKIAKRLGIPCICEIRDLWPETLVAYGMVSRTNLLIKLLYRLEKWIYEKSNAIIFTMEGGYDYICERKWNKKIGKSKVHHINNGIDLNVFHQNRKNFKINDTDLENPDIYKVVYTGSIRKVNNLGLLLDVAKEIENHKIKFLIWGDGDERPDLEKRVKDEKIDNIIFKDKVDKKYVPYIVSKADLNIMHSTLSPIFRFGISANKMFDYLAAGKPLVSDFPCKYNPSVKYRAGIDVQNPTPKNIANAIETMFSMSDEEYRQYCYNAAKAAEKFDFKVLTKKLLDIIKN